MDKEKGKDERTDREKGDNKRIWGRRLGNVHLSPQIKKCNCRRPPVLVTSLESSAKLERLFQRPRPVFAQALSYDPTQAKRRNIAPF